MRLLATAGDVHGLLAGIRLRTPLQALCAQRGWTLTLRSFHDCSRADLAAAEVLIVQRGTTARAWRLQRAARLRGVAVVYDIDDLLTDLAPHISNHAALQAQQGGLRRCLAEADVLGVSTERLGAELRRDLGPGAGLPPQVLLPNCSLPLGELPLPARGSGPVSLLFASSDRLATPFIYPALRALQAACGAAVQVVVVGPPAAGFAAEGIAVQAHPLMPRDEFIALARRLPQPLAVIPLEDSRFAACKSAIKWFEYAEAGVPTLCSDLSPYREVVDDGRTGRLVANDPAAWQAALAEAVADAGWCARVAVAARAAVRTRHTLALTVAAWEQAVRLAVDQRAAHPLAAPSLGWRLQAAWGAVTEGLAQRLRQLNRARLARRQRARR